MTTRRALEEEKTIISPPHNRSAVLILVSRRLLQTARLADAGAVDLLEAIA